MSFLLSVSLVALGSPAAPSTAPHPNSLSETRLDVRRSTLTRTTAVQILSLTEVFPELDPDLDGRAEPGVVERYSAEIAAYVAAHHRLVANPGPMETERAGELSAWTPLEAIGPGTAREAPPRDGALLEISNYVLVEHVFELAEPPLSLGVETDLFADTSPLHQDLGLVVWNGMEVAMYQLAAQERHVVEPTPEALERARSGFVRFVEYVSAELPRKWDLALLAALIAAAAGTSRRRVTVALTVAFAVAAGVFFGERAVDLLPASRITRFLALAVPLSVAYVAADSWLSKAPRGRWLEALVFGFVAGAREMDRWSLELLREEPVEPARLGLVCAVCAVALGGGLIGAASPGLMGAGRGRGRVALALSVALGLAGFAWALRS